MKEEIEYLIKLYESLLAISIEIKDYDTQCGIVGNTLNLERICYFDSFIKNLKFAISVDEI
jgi:hypothetical protein